MFNFQNARTFAVVAVLFAAATVFNARQEPEQTAGKGRLVVPVTEPVPVDVRLGPTTLPGVSVLIAKRS
jgi:hypothetical protein